MHHKFKTWFDEHHFDPRDEGAFWVAYREGHTQGKLEGLNTARNVFRGKVHEAKATPEESKP